MVTSSHKKGWLQYEDNEYHYSFFYPTDYYCSTKKEGENIIHLISNYFPEPREDPHPYASLTATISRNENMYPVFKDKTIMQSEYDLYVRTERTINYQFHKNLAVSFSIFERIERNTKYTPIESIFAHKVTKSMKIIKDIILSFKYLA